MSVLRRHARTAIALSAVFLGGWAGGTAQARRERTTLRSVSIADPIAGEATAPPAACTDRLAMEANANLVGQVHDYRGRLAIAQEREKEAETKVAAVANAPPARLVTSREEWARMAREGTVRVRTPCARWEAAGRFAVRKARGGVTTGSSRSIETSRRADAAGFAPEELETLADAYHRAHARTWAVMRSACESNASFRESIAEHEDPAADLRISLCRGTVLDMSEATTRTAITRVAELRAAGVGIERASSDEQRVTFALTNAPATLFEEMVRALGREKATRAVDNGVLCLDETLYDLRETEPEG